MIESIEFRNFKSLRKTSLPLGRCTLVIGPNGSGKTTALQALAAMANPALIDYSRVCPVGWALDANPEVTLRCGPPYPGATIRMVWTPGQVHGPQVLSESLGQEAKDDIKNRLTRIRIYNFGALELAQDVALSPNAELASAGSNLVGVLDRLRDEDPERFEELNVELGRWLPEFDRILFDTPAGGTRRFALRTRRSRKPIRAAELSQGTLFALAILLLGYLPVPPPLIGLEEPDHGIHPRLLRQIRDALYRLSHPESPNTKRASVQVIATTHSPFLLDLFREHPEEIVIAEKLHEESRFERLSDRQDLHEILGDAALSEVWFSGILGGVPREQ